MDIAKALAEFVDQVEFDQLPEDVKEKSKT